MNGDRYTDAVVRTAGELAGLGVSLADMRETDDER